MMRFLAPLLLLALTAACGQTIHALNEVDRKANNFLMDSGMLVNSSTSYSNYSTRDYRRYRGDVFEYGTCSTSEYANSGVSRSYDAFGQRRYSLYESRSLPSTYCSGERTYLRGP